MSSVDVDIDIHDIIARAEARGWSVYRLAQEALVQPGRVYAYRSGAQSPSVETLLRLAQAVGARLVLEWPDEDEDEDGDHQRRIV